jgi:hypothetical protein
MKRGQTGQEVSGFSLATAGPNRLRAWLVVRVNSYGTTFIVITTLTLGGGLAFLFQFLRQHSVKL